MQTASFSFNLPAPLLQALAGLESPVDGLPALELPVGEHDFWMRLAEHLQGLEALADALPEDLDAERLAAWLAATLGGDELPHGGEDLPPVGALDPDASPSPEGGDEAVIAEPSSPGERLPAWLTVLPQGGERGDAESAQVRRMLWTDTDPAIRSAARSETAPPAPSAAAATSLADGAPGVQPATPQASPAAPRVLQLDVPLHQPGWDRALGDRVQWMANQNVQVAELRLNPPNLGPLEVRVHVEGDRTHINFLAPQAAVREAVDAALPRLREMFAEGGLALGDVTVSHQDARQAGGEAGRGFPGAGSGFDGSGVQGEAPDAVDAPRRGLGLVDYYA